MRCYYEILQVPQNADDAEIKSAYRKLALKWHPDKNLENTEHAKDQFQLVQQAYEVLSDKHERAWYDNHRDQILHGANSEFQDNSLDVFQFFGNCFKGYGDDENGFYTVYRNVFEKIAKEDMDFMEDKEEFCDIPGFGNSQTDYEKVAAFYAYWSNYVTKKSYVWLDPHNVRDIRDRRYLKLVEKENKKVRQNAKKERNEEIKNLVAFVKKRDKRVQYQKKLLLEKQLLNKKKREQQMRDKKLQRQQELQDSNFQPEWSKFDNFKIELEELEKTLAEEFGDNLSNSSENDSEDELNSLYCVACNKIFKTPKSFQNHESSKKHKENIELLKTSLLIEEHETEECDPEETIEEENIYTNSDNEKNIRDGSELVHDENLEISYDSDLQESQIKCKKKKKQKKIIAHETDKGDCDINLDLNSDDDTFFSSKKQKKGKRKTNKSNANFNGTNEHSDSIDSHFSASKVPTTEKTKPEEEKEEELNHIGKPKKNKRNKKTKNDNTGTVNDLDVNHNCLTCKSVFVSKNKLFDHLKKTGHGVYLGPNLKNKTKQDDSKK